MSKRKFITEFAVNMVGGPVIELQQDYLEKMEETPHTRRYPLHIYMIGQRPRITIDVDSLKLDDTTFSGRFLVQKQNTFTPHEFRMRNQLGTSRVRFEAPYPHNQLRAIDESDKVIANHRVTHLVRFCDPRMWDLLDLEVLYVGQSYGVEGARTAPARLLKHETLQAIYAEAMLRSPDKDIWLLLWHFEPQLLVSMDGRSTDIEKTLEEDTGHIGEVLRTEVTEQQRINFTEAALIRYFQPQFNKEYKETFPNPAHKTYTECYDLDINSVCVALDTEDLRTRLWTPDVLPRWQHLPAFNLHSGDERRSMFDFFSEGWEDSVSSVDADAERGASPATNRYFANWLGCEVSIYETEGFALVWAKTSFWVIAGGVAVPDKRNYNSIELSPSGGSFPAADHALPPVVLATLGRHSWEYIRTASEVSTAQRQKIQESWTQNAAKVAGSSQSRAFQDDLDTFGEAAWTEAPDPQS